MINDIVFVINERGTVTFKYDRLPYHPRVGETVVLVQDGDELIVTHVHWQVYSGKLFVHCEPRL